MIRDSLLEREIDRMKAPKYAVMAVVGKYHYHIADTMFHPPVFFETRALANDAMERILIDKYNCIFDNRSRDRRAKVMMNDEDDYDYIDITTVTRFYVKFIFPKTVSAEQPKKDIESK
jgi:hypothetical protein